MSCLSGTLCGGGNGVCQESMCTCNDSRLEDAGDFRLSTACTVNVAAIHILWALLAAAYTLSFLLSISSLVLMKRKSESSKKFDVLQAWMVLIASVFAIALAIMELTTAGRIGVELSVSVVFAGFNFTAWIILILKPISKSETSLARFAMQRISGSTVMYWKVFPLLIILTVVATILPIASSLNPPLAKELLMGFAFCSAIITFVMGVTAFFGAKTVTKDLARAMANPTMSRRGSLQHRVNAFFRNARRVMFAAGLCIIVFCMALLVFGLCAECVPYMWALCPCFMGVLSSFFLRNMLISSQTSWRNRFHVTQTSNAPGGANHQVLSSKEQTVASPGQPRDHKHHDEVTSTSIGTGSVQRRKKRSGNHKAGKTKRKPKNMTAVIEGDYEGTVVMTQIDGLSPYTSASRTSGRIDVLDEMSGEQSNTNPDQDEYSELTEEREKT